jgi:hypothetical protein
MERSNMDPGQGVAMPGTHVAVALREWALSKLIDHQRAAGLSTAIVNDLDLATVTVQFMPVDVDGDLHPDFVALVVEADTVHGGHFRQLIPWNPIGAVNTLTQIVQTAGGVIHA